MANCQFVDLSSWQSTAINWPIYVPWSRLGDGKARLAVRASVGTANGDSNYDRFIQDSQSAGVAQTFHYHYSYPQYNDPAREADFFHQITGQIGQNDIAFLDFEENVPQATSDYALNFLTHLEAISGKTPGIYASSSYITSRLQDTRLKRFPLWLANWTFAPGNRPVCPFPWEKYYLLQYTDRLIVPGIVGAVDANVFLGGAVSSSTVPAGWHDDPDKKILMAPNGMRVRMGFRDYVLKGGWDAGNMPLDEERAVDEVLYHNLSVGPGDIQHFRDCYLWWTPRAGLVKEPYPAWELQVVYEKFLQSQKELSASNQRIFTLEAELQAAQKLIDPNLVQILKQIQKLVDPLFPNTFF